MGEGRIGITDGRAAPARRVGGSARALALGGLIGFAALIVSACAMAWGSSGDEAAPAGGEERAAAFREPAGAESPEIRIRLLEGAERATVDAGGRVIVADAGAERGARILPGPLEVRLGPRGWLVRTPDGAFATFARKDSDPPELRFTPPRGELIELDGTALPGELRLHAKAAERFDVVEIAPIESYLRG